ncbi:orotidine-5'-phosphate decarboxylase [Hazenella coriacea]|uniref:Orotidine 5'-phosphate decarboxylase n=1 Tax=Hazenella coriacea TaxID=1179467 RepID=A0A4R3L6A7_9BACL|nr:orotidine-5'-phosphate decarboxylase [Hazenella coriacea]TCS94598.1 orotidine-5'-phosphate decarboxylase [Hazenella coriacea]
MSKTTTEHPIIIALDFPGAPQAEIFLNHWDKNEAKPFIKIGYQLFFQVGPSWVAKRKEEGYSIFLDLKLHDIPNTVAKGVESLSRLGVDFLTVHAGGGQAMMQKAVEAAIPSAGSPMKILGVTQLTSTDQQVLNKEIGIQGSMEETVIRYAQLAYQSGVHGVICSGQEVKMVKQSTAPSFLAVTPGIRLIGSDTQDQKRVVTPRSAIEAGADYLVMGRPITQQKDPRQAYENILNEIRHARREQ